MQTKFELGERVWFIAEDGTYEIVEVVIDRMDLIENEVSYSGHDVDDICRSFYLNESRLFATKEEAILASIRAITERITELQAVAKQRQEELAEQNGIRL